MSIRARSCLPAWILAAACVFGPAVVAQVAPAGVDGIRVRASAAYAPCLGPVLQAFTRQTGVLAVLAVGEPDPVEGADVVMGDDSEMTRLLEGGVVDRATATDVGYLPWVIVAPREGAAASVSAIARAEGLGVLGGAVSRELRAALGDVPPGKLHLSNDPQELLGQSALVPVSLAARGRGRATSFRPLVATAAVVAASPRAEDAHLLVAFLKSDAALGLLAECGMEAAPPSGAAAEARGRYAQAVVDWWVPACSLAHNAYNDPSQVLGSPDAVDLGGKDHYEGMMSLGEGGYVIVDLGDPAVDGPGADIRVFQTTSGEPVTLYAAMGPQGPWQLVGLREYCGLRSADVFSNHCDFDLKDAGLAQARYLKIEDGEIFPCLAGSTLTEGADIDAVEVLNHQS